LGLIDSALQGSRPYSHLEAMRQVQEAKTVLEGMAAPTPAYELIRRLEIYLANYLTEPHGNTNSIGYIKPVSQLEISYVYQHGEPSVYPQTSAQQFALNYNNNGITYGDDNNLLLRLRGDALVGGFLQFDWEPLLLSSSADSLDLQWQQLRAAVAIYVFEVSVGRQSLWWGQGHHGSLVLTNNAKPLDMVRINNPSPILLPWFLKYLGPFHLDIFWSQLGKDRIVTEPYFAGMRVNIKPFSWVEIGASRGIMFGGEGRQDVDWNDFLTILGGENLGGDEEDTSNSVAAIDVRLHLPFLAGTEIYAEFGGEDEANHFVAVSAWLTGIYLPKIEPSGRLSLRLEYVNLAKFNDSWYRHGTYRSGYTYEGRILGHHVGSAAEDLFVETELLLNDTVRLALSFDFEKRGVDQPVTEKHQQVQLAVDWDLNEYFSLNFSVAFDQIKNFNYAAS
ncbi:MAG: hypothetical protein KAU22_08100, partial [Desulfuromonadales bacterium]|nr:hypothetical protein [Desulfuromonadales bacterium]